MKEDRDLTWPSLPLTAVAVQGMCVWTDCCLCQLLTLSCNMLFIAYYCLVFDLTTGPTWVTSDVSVRSVYTWIQVPADIVLFNSGKPCTWNSVLPLCEIKTAGGTGSHQIWLITALEKKKMSFSDTRDNYPHLQQKHLNQSKPEAGAHNTKGGWKLLKHCWSHPRKSLVSFIGRSHVKSLLPAASLHFPTAAAIISLAGKYKMECCLT